MSLKKDLLSVAADRDYFKTRAAELEQELKELRYAFELVTVRLDEANLLICTRGVVAFEKK